MNTSNYGITNNKKNKNIRNKITGIILILLILLIGTSILGILTSDGPEYQKRASIIEENHTLKEKVADLEKEIKRLESELKKKETQVQESPSPAPEGAESTNAPSGPATPREYSSIE